MCVFPFFGICCCEIIYCLFLWMWLNSLCWNFPSHTLCKAELVARYWINLVLSWNILFCLSIVTESFARYRSLGWHPWSFSVYITFDQDLLAFTISIEKSGVILIGLPLYVTWLFSFAALTIPSLFCMFSVLIIMWWGDFFFDPVYWCSVSFLYFHWIILL